MKMILKLMTAFFIAMFLWQCTADRTEKLTASAEKELAILPVTEEMALAYANVAEMRESPFFALLRDSIYRRMDNDAEFKDFLEATQFDVRKDVNEVFVAFNPKPYRHGQSEFIAVVTGNYDPQRILDFIRSKSDGEEIQQREIGKHTVYSGPKGGMSMCFADDHHVLVGSDALVEKWLARFDGAEKPQSPGTLAAHLNNIKYKNGAWLVVDAREMVDKWIAEVPGNMRNEQVHLLKKVQFVSGSVAAGKDLKVDGSGRFSDAESAGIIRDMVKGGLATLKLSMSNSREAVDVINKVDVSTENNQVRINASFTQEDLQTMMKQRPGMAMR